MSAAMPSDSLGESKSTNLYRIVPFERAVQLFTRRTLYFSSPRAWDDPYEVAVEHSHSNSMFAQCWSSKSMSDAMWRIYSPNALGIRIGTTRQRIHSELTKALKAGQIGKFSIKDVRYAKSKVVQTNFRNLSKILEKTSQFEFAVAALTIKRDAFEHEQEVRVVVADDEWSSENNLLGREVQVDPVELVRSILVDPRAPEEYLAAYKHYFEEVLGFKGNVARSGLYATPEHFVVSSAIMQKKEP
ncbi:MAG: DUF2971 domain-containing protein [Hydrogenophaga sp.]|nr:DUF2971 domain-containing protein [Hydrogenophaga sp.]